MENTNGDFMSTTQLLHSLIGKAICKQQQKIEFYVNGGVRSKIINPMKQILKDQFTYVSLCIIEQEYINIVK